MVLNVETENVKNEEELWVLDFQQYDLDGTMAVTTNDGGTLDADNTGSCSNIFDDVPYSVSYCGFVSSSKIVNLGLAKLSIVFTYFVFFFSDKSDSLNCSLWSEISPI